MRRLYKKAVLVTALPAYHFWVHNGPVIGNIKELKDALAAGTVSLEQFVYHAAGERNDFAVWMHDVLGDAACAKSFRRVRSPKTAVRMLNSYLGEYQ